MSDLASLDPQQITRVCQENAAAIAETLSQCFDISASIAFADAVPLNDADWSTMESINGVAVNLIVGDQILAVLIPETVPLPGWYASPDDSQSARLQTLGMEWSLNILPEDFVCEEYVTHAIEHIPAAIELADPAEEACCLVGQVTLDTASESTPVWLVWPLSRAVGAAVESVNGASENFADDDHSLQQNFQSTAAPPRVPVGRLLKMPVTLSVRLAERKVDLKHLLNIAPGALLTFNKSCEELLDLYVNNERYCQGEAVKIGEKFGLKINTFVEKQPEV